VYDCVVRVVSHLCANFAAPHCFIIYTGDKFVFHSKKGNVCTLLEHIDPPAYNIAKMGVMSAAVEMERRKEVPVNCATTIILPYSMKIGDRDKLMDKKKTKAAHVKDTTNIVQMDKMAELIFLWMKGNQRPDNGTFMEFKVEDNYVFPLIV